MGSRISNVLVAAAFATSAVAHPEQVIDIPTRPGVTQRFLYLAPPDAKAAVVLFSGGNGGLQIADDGSLGGGSGNFLVRSRQLFAEQRLAVAVIDAPSDRQSPPFLGGYRQRPDHAADVKAVIAWLRQKSALPVWLIGTSRGTQSVAYVATRLVDDGGPDGIVLTATVLADRKSRPVPDMPMDSLRIPVLVVHHEQDGCRVTLFSDVPRLMEKLASNPRKELMTFTGGANQGDPCQARAYHGFNGLEREVVEKIAAWMLR
ncbi:MAG: alpha/beta hydrolase [Betaproteobacteria bacterium]|nr:alpha/beta hydrolase [Betaproteobacteria bacterium]